MFDKLMAELQQTRCEVDEKITPSMLRLSVRSLRHRRGQPRISPTNLIGHPTSSAKKGTRCSTLLT